MSNGPTPFDWLVLVIGSVRRRPVVAVTVLVLGLGALYVYFDSSVRLYRVEAKILVQQQQGPSSIGRVAPDAPTRSASDLVHARENLVALIRQTNLGASSRVPQRSNLVARLWPRPAAAPLQERDVTSDLVEALDRALHVGVDDATITISIDWPEPGEAYQLVNTAEQNFLEARHVQEITAFDDVIAVLAGRVQGARKNLESVIADVQRNVTRDPNPVATRSPTVTLGATSTSDELAQLQSKVESKERAIRDVEEFRRRRLADLQAQLDQTRAVFADSYPAVVTLRQDIEALSHDSPQLLALREEHRKLRQEYIARKDSRKLSANPAPRGMEQSSRYADALVDQNERVKEARFQYQQLVDRLNAANVELDAARTGFKYRYTVVWPAEVPKDPVKPNPRKIFGAGGVAVLVLAMLAAAAPDLWSRRVVERWQVERMLDLPVVGEVTRR